MLKFAAEIFRITGVVLVLSGIFFPSLLTDLLPVGFPSKDLDPFGSSPSTRFARVVPIEPSHWIEISMIGVGAALFAAGEYLRRHLSQPD